MTREEKIEALEKNIQGLQKILETEIMMNEMFNKKEEDA